jgi:hypothetical protein
VDVPETAAIGWLNISNCGVVVIKKGAISMVELEKELFEIVYKE